MTKLQEYLCNYITEDRISDLASDEEYIHAQQVRDAAEKKLSALLITEQIELFSCYMDEENYLASLYLRHIFQEPLALAPDLLNLTL